MPRRLILLAALALPGCSAVGAPGAPLLAIPAAVEGVSLRAFGRTTGDAIVSLVTGEDCSIARIGRGEAYCGRNDPPEPPPLCTRSLGGVDCWRIPPAAWPPYRGVADGPATLTEAQENDRIGWTGRIGRALRPEPRPAPEAPAAEPVITPAALAPPVTAPAEPPPAPAALPAATTQPTPRPRRRATPSRAAPAPAPAPAPAESPSGPPPTPVIEPAPQPAT